MVFARMGPRTIRGENAMTRRAGTRRAGTRRAAATKAGEGALPAPAASPARAPGDGPATAEATEPGTVWALWPTFMRRTLAEEEVRPPHPVMEQAG